VALVRWQDWDPFSDMRSVRERINRLFDERFAGFPAPTEETFTREWAPPVDIHEDKDNIVVKAEVPGMKKEDVSIEIKDNVLTLKGERKFEKETKKEDYHRMERSYGSFVRSFSLPSAIKVDKVVANYKDGILEITLPKAEEAKPKAIPIKIA